jgi:hypothetical protein
MLNADNIISVNNDVNIVKLYVNKGKQTTDNYSKIFNSGYCNCARSSGEFEHLVTMQK